jgi:hypothetical protein
MVQKTFTAKSYSSIPSHQKTTQCIIFETVNGLSASYIKRWFHPVYYYYLLLLSHLLTWCLINPSITKYIYTN